MVVAVSDLVFSYVIIFFYFFLNQILATRPGEYLLKVNIICKGGEKPKLYSKKFAFKRWVKFNSDSRRNHIVPGGFAAVSSPVGGCSRCYMTQTSAGSTLLATASSHPPPSSLHPPPSLPPSLQLSVATIPLPLLPYFSLPCSQLQMAPPIKCSDTGYIYNL